MTNEEFYTEVMSYTGMYPRFQLEKFYTYYTQKKHFSTFKTFNVKMRLRTWFDPKRKEKFKSKNKNKSEQDIMLSILKANLGKFNPLR